MTYRRAFLVITALLMFYTASAQAWATTRYAVPAGGSSDSTCMTPAANCSLRHVLEDVILTADEVIVMPGTYDLGTTGVTVRTGSNSVSIHGDDAQPRPTITAGTGGGVLTLCADTCPADLSTIRHLRLVNTGTGSALLFRGGSTGNPVSIDDVEATAGSGSASWAILGWAQDSVPSEATIRNTVAYAPNAGSNGGAIHAAMNLTMRNVTALAPGPNGIAFTLGPMCGIGICTGNAAGQVVNSILAGGPGGADVRTIGTYLAVADISLDYSNYDDVLNGIGSSITSPGSGHNQTAAPLLAGGSDVHQQPGSPTIDAGVDAVANAPTDPDGNPRKLGAAPDIGAYEDGHARPTTEAAANVTETGATLRGSVDPLGSATTYYFEWGATSAYGNRTPAPAASAGGGSAPQSVAQDLAGLAPGTTVHYRLVAANSFGPASGADQSFTTLVPPQAQIDPGPGPGTAGNLTFAGVTLTAHSLVVNHSRYVLLPIRCPAEVSGSCTGTIKLAAPAGKKKITLGTATFSIRGGVTKKVKLNLSRPARKLLKAKHSVKAGATLVATAGGQKRTGTQTVTVRVPRKPSR